MHITTFSIEPRTSCVCSSCWHRHFSNCLCQLQAFPDQRSKCWTCSGFDGCGPCSATLKHPATAAHWVIPCSVRRLDGMRITCPSQRSCLCSSKCSIESAAQSAHMRLDRCPAQQQHAANIWYSPANAIAMASCFKGVLQSKKWISQNYTRRVVYVYTSYCR